MAVRFWRGDRVLGIERFWIVPAKYSQREGCISPEAQKERYNLKPFITDLIEN